MAQLHLIKQSQGILIPATPETSDFLQSKCKLGSVLEADYKLVRNPAFHRRYFALLNLGFEYWEPTGGAISSNERRLITGYAKYLAAYGGSESALLDAAGQYLDRIPELYLYRFSSACGSAVYAENQVGLLDGDRGSDHCGLHEYPRYRLAAFPLHATCLPRTALYQLRNSNV